MHESNRVNERSAQAATRSAGAAEESAKTAQRAAVTADNAERHLNRFRLHDDTMRTLYWAADHAVTQDSSRGLLGLEVLAALVEQAERDSDSRTHNIVSATDEAVRKVAIPTFFTILTTAANGDDGNAGVVRVSALEINAARLLSTHAPDLSPELRREIDSIARSSPGMSIAVEQLHTGRHIDRVQSRELGLEETLDRDGPGLSM
ncbi:hypothetical protein [Rhodococcus qingshengii]|uniref:hypothetical protein n=1 Tax=Rhodococcus qingshengii TaxID=334542 RepID=UPI00237C5CA7|nr:hypothetical protein [Rhodococcus qingshengii]WCT06165.1 hypothetical protein PI247_31090 [Rhodococcus qingshengii]